MLAITLNRFFRRQGASEVFQAMQRGSVFMLLRSTWGGIVSFNGGTKRDFDAMGKSMVKFALHNVNATELFINLENPVYNVGKVFDSCEFAARNSLEIFSEMLCLTEDVVKLIENSGLEVDACRVSMLVHFKYCYLYDKFFDPMFIVRYCDMFARGDLETRDKYVAETLDILNLLALKYQSL